MNPTQLRTSNAALVLGLLRSAMAGEYKSNGELKHNHITRAPLTTENSSLFSQAHFSEPMTNYATGWKDPHNYQALSDFIAPPLQPSGELFEHIQYNNAEAFLSDVNGDDDLRAIYAEFKTVEYSSTKTRRQIPNRGLRICLDWDLIKTMPNWQQFYTSRLLERLQRNGYRRKVALALAAGTAASLTWGSTADPDGDIATQAKLAGDASGISPNRAIWGIAAKLLRFTSTGSQATSSGFGGRIIGPEEASLKWGVTSMVDDSRYQSGVTKTANIGSKIVLFSAFSANGEDPSNFKTAIGMTSQGTRFAVYVRQLSVKFWEIVVECYETEFVATTLGVRTLTIS